MKSMESSAAISGDSLIIKEKTTENLGMRAQDDMPTMREKICYGFGDVYWLHLSSLCFIPTTLAFRR